MIFPSYRLRLEREVGVVHTSTRIEPLCTGNLAFMKVHCTGLSSPSYAEEQALKRMTGPYQHTKVGWATEKEPYSIIGLVN